MKSRNLTPEEMKLRAKIEREKRAVFRLANPLPPKLSKEELYERQLARQRKYNAIKKEQRLAARLAGIKPSYKVSPERKEAMKFYAREKRAKERALLPPKPEQEPKPIKVPTTKKAPKPVFLKPVKKMLPIKLNPVKVMVQAKPDLFQQPPVSINNNSTAGKIKVIIKPGFEVFVKPGANIEQIRAKYLNR
jgi:hypothetical protein